MTARSVPSANEFRLHPEYARRYREAWKAWCANPKLAEACAVLGMSDLEWAKRYVELFGPLTFSTDNTNDWYIFDPARAWFEAMRPVAVPDA